MKTDCIFYVTAEVDGIRFIASIMDEYLNNDGTNLFGKIIYSSIPLYGARSIQSPNPNWYKAAYILTDGIAFGVDDFFIQEQVSRCALPKGTGIHSNLTKISKNIIEKIIRPKIIGEDCKKSIPWDLLERISLFYCIPTARLSIWGSLLLFPEHQDQCNDLDVIIPISTLGEARRIINARDLHTEQRVLEYGIKWKLRWIDGISGKIICPFFIYSGITPPITDIKLNGCLSEESLSIVDDTYSIFNMPVLKTNGAADFVCCRSSIVRGLFKTGDILQVSCPLSIITTGEWVGKKVAFINDPDHQIQGFQVFLG